MGVEFFNINNLNITLYITPNHHGYLELECFTETVSHLAANKELFINDTQYVFVNWLAYIVEPKSEQRSDISRNLPI